MHCLQPAVRRQQGEAVIDIVCGYALTTNTLRSYRTQESELRRIAALYYIPLDQLLSEHDLCLALIAYAQSHKPTTLPQFVSAVANWSQREWQRSLPRGRRYDAVRTSLLNLHGADNFSIPKVAITMDDLLAIRRQLDMRYFEHARDWCACLIAFFGLLRIGEYMDAGLRVRHVRPEAASLEITVQYSKTCRSPAQVSVSARNDQLCPLRAFLHYRGFLARLGLATGPDSALFVFRFDTRQHSPMSGQQFIQLVRCHLAAAFPDSNVSGYAGHSCRRGGASALILAGVHADLVKSHGRWSSDTYLRYFDAAHSPAMRLAATHALASAPM